MIDKRTTIWRADLLLFLAFFSFYLILGIYLSQVKHYLPYDSLSRLVSAWLVWRGTEIKLATIGFVWPPIPTLLLIPLAWIPALVKSWLAVVIVSASAMALATVVMKRILNYCGVNGIWKWVFVALFGLNPLNVVFGINGMSEPILVTACLIAFYALLRFWDSNRNLHMMVAALFFGLLPLIRYEYALLSAAAGLVIIFHCWTTRSSQTNDEFRAFLEGRLLAFSSLAIYPIFLWSLASWQIMGSPIYFLVNDRSATSLAELQLSGLVGINSSPLGFLWIVIQAWVLSFPAGFIAWVTLLIASWRTQSTKLLGFALLPMIIPLIQFFLLSQRSNVPLLRYYMTTVLFGFFMLALAIGTIRKLSRLSSTQYHLLAAAAAVLVLASNFATASTLENYPYQNIERHTWNALVTSETVTDIDFSQAYQIGQLLPGIVPPGSRVLIDTYQFGFGIILGSNNPALFMDFTDPNYDAAVLNPVPYVDYVLVPQTEGRGAFYSINRTHPRLHEEGSKWSTLVDVLPVTNLQWRLYKVIK
jgi:hypothetical protein